MVQPSRTGNRSECYRNLEKGALWRGPPDRNGGLWSRDIGNPWATQQRARGKERHPNITHLLSPDLLQLASSAGFTHPAAGRQGSRLPQYPAVRLPGTGQGGKGRWGMGLEERREDDPRHSPSHPTLFFTRGKRIE